MVRAMWWIRKIKKKWWDTQLTNDTRTGTKAGSNCVTSKLVWQHIITQFDGPTPVWLHQLNVMMHKYSLCDFTEPEFPVPDDKNNATIRWDEICPSYDPQCHILWSTVCDVKHIANKTVFFDKLDSFNWISVTLTLNIMCSIHWKASLTPETSEKISIFTARWTSGRRRRRDGRLHEQPGLLRTRRWIASQLLGNVFHKTRSC